MSHGQTPSQTVGPFFAYGLTAEQYGYPFTQIAGGVIASSDESIRIMGQILDGEGRPVPDALIEIWQPRAGFGRQGTGATADNTFQFETLKPTASSATAAPFLTAIVFTRGLLSHLYTRIYFDDEAAANATDDVLGALPPDRRATLMARREGPRRYRFDIHLQGDAETVFFDV
jgi:protocatechuate 3,4-dioxygenase alpha subunit